ncbi:peptide/nickel transport system permease protein [Kaistia hirudinis]|uniref:Peptide/nickel transport system permease protein n=1 Tax=Kaistia hirudinis TaxID=1293440 RepID=A0A840AL70_9HYPH|nr:ABC transporter permease [Kaistia hirudinis]MBB3929325.1 peptide/nickel transport system permease protein [Kaistia hirudinis]MBN9018650.1 ABC transporter permease [Hyphomicrobiales bacterium]
MSDAAPLVEDVPARPRRRLMRRSAWTQPLGLVGAALLVIIVLLAIFAPWLTAHGPIDQVGRRFMAPSAEHWFGTDQIGRDVFARVIYGARVSLPYALQLVIMASVIGTLLGAIAGYFGGWIDGFIMRAADLVMAFPDIILAMAVVAALGPGLFNAVLAVVVVSWPIYARVVRSMILTIRDEPYVQSSRLLGVSTARALWVDVRPNVMGPLVVLAALEFGHAVLILAGLSFLGLGAQPPAPEWGSMVSEGSKYFDKWWLSVFPGLAILLVVLAANFLGDTLRDALDPRTAKAFR